MMYYATLHFSVDGIPYSTLLRFPNRVAAIAFTERCDASIAVRVVDSRGLRSYEKAMGRDGRYLEAG